MESSSAVLLIVDDQPSIRRMLYEAFHTEGYEVYTAASGEQALLMACSHPPRVILLDLKIPGEEEAMTLLETLKQRNPHTKVIVMTASAFEEMPQLARRYGVERVIPKPFDVLELRQDVRKYMNIPSYQAHHFIAAEKPAQYS